MPLSTTPRQQALRTIGFASFFLLKQENYCGLRIHAWQCLTVWDLKSFILIDDSMSLEYVYDTCSLPLVV